MQGNESLRQYFQYHANNHPDQNTIIIRLNPNAKPCRQNVARKVG